MKMPDHMFHGYAAGFGARIEKPFWRQVAEATTALPPVGGRVNAVTRDYQLEGLFAFSEARSSALGHFYHGQDKETVTAETRVSASVKGLVIPGVLSVDWIGMALVSERDFPSGERRFRVEEARVEGLRVFDPAAGEAKGIDYDAARDAAAHLQPFCGRGASARELGETLKKRGTDALYLSQASRDFEAALGARKPTLSVRKGDTTYDIFLVELLVRHGQVDLNMFRVEMTSNPRGGSGSGAGGGVNGNPSV